jgi:branched-chain amino acid transport system ATP-binding protein
MLEVEKLVVRYGNITALQGISLRVERGEIVGVIGPNGAGKSTLLLAVAGDVPVATGDVRFDGQSLVGEPPEGIVQRGLSLVPEGRHIFHRLTVSENLGLGATARADRSALGDDLERVFELFPILHEYRGTQASRLSGGEQQMLAIGRALLARPALLMLDEPSLGLAPIVIDRVFETLEELRTDGLTILLVEQNAARTLELADRIYVLRTGTIELAGPSEELARNPRFEEAFLGFV